MITKGSSPKLQQPPRRVIYNNAGRHVRLSQFSMLDLNNLSANEISSRGLFWRIVSKYKLSLFARVVLCTAGVIGLAIIPRLVGNLIGALSVSPSATNTAITWFVSANFGVTALWFIDDLLSARYKPMMRKYLTDTLMTRILHQNKRYFTDNNPGKLVAAVQDAGYSIFVIVESLFAALVICGSILLYVYESYNIHLYVGMLMTGWLVAWILAVYYFTARGIHHSERFIEENIELSSHAANVLENIISVQSACAEGHESRLVRRHSSKNASAEFKMELINAFGTTAQYLTIMIVDALVYIVAAKMYFDGIITVREIVQFGIIIAIIINITRAVSKQTKYFVESCGKYATCIALLGQKLSEKPFLEDVMDLDVIDGDIRVSNLSFTHQNLETEDGLFKNISLHIKKGETVGFVGQSGSGKTTLVNLLMGQYNHRYSGSISIGGIDIKTISIQQLRRCFAYVPQKITMFRRNVYDNIGYGCPKAETQDILRASQDARADRFVQELPEQYNTVLNVDGIELSGGQQQRIMMARAMAQLCTASILIIDEGTSALDTETEQEIEQSLHSILDRTDKTCIIIAHRLSTIRKADKIVVFDKGRIVEVGTHDSLLATENSAYKKLWHAQLV